MAKFESKTGCEGVRLGSGCFFTNFYVHDCDFRFCFPVWFCFVVGFLLGFAFPPLLGLTLRRKGNVYVVHVLFSFRLAFAGFVLILLSFCFLLRVQHVCGLRVCFFPKKKLLSHVSDGYKLACIFESKSVCLIGHLFSNFYVVHGSYMIRFVLQFSFAKVDWEKPRKTVCLFRHLFSNFYVVHGCDFPFCFPVWFGSSVWLVVRTRGNFSFVEFDLENLRVSDYKVMARVADKIKLIDGSREALKLSVRITDLWFIGIPRKTEQAKMEVVDSDGDEIHFACKQDQLKSRMADLKENFTYVMHNFKVIKNDGKFRVCDHEYKLCFTEVIVVTQCDMEQLPFRKFRFVSFSSVIAGDFKIGLLVDVIGVVDGVVFRYVSSKNTRVVLNLKDLSGQVLSCTLWENYCLQFLSYLNDIEDERPIVILLTHARIKEAQGSYPASVSNSFKASKLMINDLVLEIQEFRESLLDLGIEVRAILAPIGQGSSQVSGSSQLSSKDAFLSKTEVKNISEINVSLEVIKSNVSFFKQEFVCVTVAKITTIVMDNYSWCYPACGQCYKKADMQTVSFTCPCGKENDQPVLRVNKPNFFIWDRECAQLIGQSADEVNRLKIEDGGVDLNAYPQALDRLLGCFLAFKVKVQARFRNSVVLKYSDELDLINVPCCKIENSILESTDPTVLESQSLSITADHDRSMLALSEPTEFEFQSVSVTGDHDPLLRIPLTPTKRVSSDELDNERKNFEISPAEIIDKDRLNARIISVQYKNADKCCQTISGYSDLGDQAMQCINCNAKMWYDERISKGRNTTSQKFSLCCGDGKVELPLLQSPPKYLERLLFDGKASDSKNYQCNIRTYNMIFAFTSAGIKLDKSINESRGPPTIRIQGQPCHRIGNLLPMPGKQPKFSQLYIFDTQNEIENRVNTMSQHVGIQPEIVSTLGQMLDEYNVHAKNFRMARDKLADTQVDNVKLRLIATCEKDDRTYNLPNVSEVAALIVGDFDPDSRRDIIVETQNGELQRIHELHSSYLGLQYPLLFPYGEDGYRPDILHRCTPSSRKRKRNCLTMRE
ncbi:Replication protein A DNA-binding subunit B [Glycine soja]